MFSPMNVLTKAMTIDEASIIESVVGLLWGKRSYSGSRLTSRNDDRSSREQIFDTDWRYCTW